MHALNTQKPALEAKEGPTELSPPLRSHLPEILGHESRTVILSYKRLLSQKENSQNVRDERSFVGKNLGQIPKNFQVSLSQQGFFAKMQILGCHSKVLIL